MLKHFLSRATMLAAVAMLSVVSVSCSDDEEPQEPLPTPEVIGMMVTYEAQIDSAMLNFLDVSVEYTDFDNRQVSAPVEGKTWSKMVAFERDNGGLPEYLGIFLKIAKKQSPVFEGEAARLEGFVDIRSYSIMSDSSVIQNAISSVGIPEKITFSADKLDDYIERINGIYTDYEVNLQYDEHGKIILNP